MQYIRIILGLSVFCIQAVGICAQNEFVYQKGKSFQTVPSYRMQRVLRPDSQHDSIQYEEKIPVHQTTISYHVELPGYVQGLFFSRDSRPGDYEWPNNTNRLLPWCFGQLKEIVQPDYPGIPSNAKPSLSGDALLLQLADGQYLFAKALSGENSLSWFQIDQDGSLKLYLSTLGTDCLPLKAPLFLSGYGKSVYETLQQSYHRLIENTETSSLIKREDKVFFEAFNYLGWCTWEHYHYDINETKILKDLDTIEASGLPIRYVLIDDGHLSHTDRQLKSFVPDKERFPNEWKKILARKRDTGIKWFGLWYALSGYWEGVALKNDFPEEVKKHLYTAHNCLLPGPDSCSIRTFYQYYVRSMKNYGFDFLKIDNQAYTLPLYMGEKESVRRARLCNEAMEQNTHEEQIGLMNCMAQNVINTDHTRYSNVTRVSIDYKKYDMNMAKSHLFQSYTNTLLLGHTVWPDHDMFHSSDTICGSLMARSKALSGGPVYLSDAPEDFVEAHILPLVDETGRIFRPTAPAIPTPESIFRNPLQDGKAHRVFAPTGDEAVSIICYNLNVSPQNRNVTASIQRSDYALRNVLDNEKQGDAGHILLYDWHTRTAKELTGEVSVTLNGFEDHLFHLCPIRNGWAVVGIQEKYISPATVQILSSSPWELKLRVLTSGTLRVWAEGTDKKELRSIVIDKPGIITLNK
ncbi:Sip1-related alpha-galactosidase [Bacteroides sp.]